MIINVIVSVMECLPEVLIAITNRLALLILFEIGIEIIILIVILSLIQNAKLFP